MILSETLGGRESFSPLMDVFFGTPMCIMACFGNFVPLDPVLQNKPLLQMSFPGSGFLLQFMGLCFGSQSLQSLSNLLEAERL